MLFAIHSNPGTWSDRWIERCHSIGISVRQVDALDDDIVTQLRGCDAFLWHIQHTDPIAMVAGQHVIHAAETMGIKCLPSLRTLATYDDKVAQKYLLESLEAPLIESHVFRNLKSTQAWIEQADLPFVFKLSRGAGAKNVQLVRNKTQALKLARTAFGRGFKPRGNYLADTIGKLQGAHTRKKTDLLGKLKRLPRTLAKIRHTNRLLGREKGYYYTQEFLPDANHDTRVTIINGKAFAFQRLVRDNDFRASGSGLIEYDPKSIDLSCIQIAFGLAEKTSIGPLAIDFVKGPGGEQKIVEISYSFLSGAVHQCPGHWLQSMAYVEGHVWPEHEMIDQLVVAANQ